MNPFFITLEDGKELKIIPETKVFMDGHPIITHDYSVYSKQREDSELFAKTGTSTTEDKTTNPNYMGMITFEEPGRYFSYTRDSIQQLSSEELNEVISQITEHREKPESWNL
ncbi:hypothetical protein [Mucilaginibacter ginkgonis]|uniref:Uncharacterized protein n=1 Tax=Mucilaginibacter ginkgonis TaxID=2682091 RepID=A0A6I4HYH1_9SPHI|nr:hypothetical protein [Mucilaginibacter ginkgonis]QQL49514.1 hypothetical protein GO620_015270 [Mucilaginibacter ginkgonis]